MPTAASVLDGNKSMKVHKNRKKGMIQLKLFKIKDIEKLFKVIDECSGKVELVSPEGDRINLKSKLSQYFSMARIFSNEEMVNELELIAYNPDDVIRLMNLMYEM